jgi:hypothetical protein
MTSTSIRVLNTESHIRSQSNNPTYFAFFDSGSPSDFDMMKPLTYSREKTSTNRSRAEREHATQTRYENRGEGTTYLSRGVTRPGAHAASTANNRQEKIPE